MKGKKGSQIETHTPEGPIATDALFGWLFLEN
jgi:hypothetical protein